MFLHIQNWLSEDESKAAWYAAFSMGLEQRSMVICDRELLQPRLTAWCCDTGQGYRYSGQETPPIDWPDSLSKVRYKLEEYLNCKFPSCLINYYRDGNDSVGWHKDDESLFGPDFVIATVSLGGPRKFKVKRDFTSEIKDFELGDGDLLVMAGEATRKWKHTVPKTVRQVNPRISLTYRTMNND